MILASWFWLLSYDYFQILDVWGLINFTTERGSYLDWFFIYSLLLGGGGLCWEVKEYMISDWIHELNHKNKNENLNI